MKVSRIHKSYLPFPQGFAPTTKREAAVSAQNVLGILRPGFTLVPGVKFSIKEKEL